MKKQSSIKLLFFILILLSTGIYSCVKDIAESPKPQPTSLCDSMKVSFSKDIQKNIIDSYCLGCHSAGAAYEIYDYNSVKTYADNGKLKDRVLDKKDMPQGNAPLPDSLLQKLNCWLEKGAPNN